MNRKSLFAVLAILSLYPLILAGCSDSAEDEPDTPVGVTAAVNNYTAQAEDRIVTGEVIEITGNEVTLALIAADGDNNDMKKPDGTDMPDFNGEPPELPDGAAKPDFDGERQDSAGKKSPSHEKTGEEETYIIPVGMTIDNLSGRNTDYSGITEGTVLTLTVNSQGIVCAACAE